MLDSRSSRSGNATLYVSGNDSLSKQTVCNVSEIQAENYKKQTRFFWKGKRVSEKVYKKRYLDQKLVKNLRTVYDTN